MREHIRILAIPFALLVLTMASISLWTLFIPHTLNWNISPPRFWAERGKVSVRNFSPATGITADGKRFSCPIGVASDVSIHDCRKRVYDYDQKLGPGHVGWVVVGNGVGFAGKLGVGDDYLTGNVCIVPEGWPLGLC